MRKDAYKRIDALSRFSEGDLELIQKKNSSLSQDVVESQVNSTDNLLTIVYAVDERTNLPTGDIQYLVSDKANPQVKQFILDNLMQDVKSCSNKPVPYDFDDDIMLELSMRDGESVSDYVGRLNSSIERDKWILNEAQRKQPVSSESE